jgi:PLP dependent protein
VTVTVAERLGRAKERIQRAGGDPARVRIVAVTKAFGPDAVEAALAAGLYDIGENYAQELLAKRDACIAAGLPAATWHFLGPLQRNKAKALAPAVDLWQAVDRAEAGRSIAHHAPGAAVMVEVRTAEATKAGCSAEDAPALVDELRGLGLNVRGLMTIGPAGDPEQARPGFARLAALASQLELAELSMGMSGDLEVAIQEGATMVRLGTALFGPRPDRGDLRR